MISSSREEERSSAKKDGGVGGTSSAASSSSSSVSWLRLKDPRIVRVSRAFGGKDRHSKVCTVRGLRDRRVRLSVSTAIQLYDLQDRLGLNQPSKVVDWLLNAAKHEIDELPPLQIPSAEFINASLLSLNRGININSKTAISTLRHNHHNHNSEDLSELSRSNLWGDHVASPRKIMGHQDKDKQGVAVLQNHRVPMPAGLLNNFMPQLSGHPFQLEPSNFSLSQTQGEEESSNNMLSTPSSFSQLPPGSHQLFLCTPGTSQSYLQSHASGSGMDHSFDPKQIHVLGSSSQNLLPISTHAPFYTASQSNRLFNFGTSPKVVSSEHGMNGDHALHEESREFPPK
ncbi:hypothetical protein Ancab_018335 [Ancistrocladus abbreviatus]